MNEEQKFKLDRWVKHEERSLSNKWYAIGRIDLLIISISGGGLFVMFETFKFVREQKLEMDLSLLKCGAIFFAAAIIVNFISQVFGFYANKYEAEFANNNIKKEIGKEVDDLVFAKLDVKIDFLNPALNIANSTSVLAMFVGIILLAVFYLRF
ncbi:MAG: hypothetical protein ACK57K_02260 [Chryseotalea sp.]|jgi:hypothetical protein